LKAIELSPKFVPARTNVARLYFELGNYKLAARHFIAATEQNPKDARLAVNAAVAETWAARAATSPAEKKELQDKAEARLKAALARDPLPAGYQALASLYEQMGQRDRAVEAYNQWLSKNPKDADALMKAAVLREATGKKEEAIDLYLRAAEASPKDPQPRFAIARLYDNMSPPKYDLAAEQYRKVIAANPNSVDAYRLLGQLLMRQPEKTAEALAAFDTLKKLAPKDPAPYIALATTYEKEKQVDKALKEYQALAALNPKDTSGHWYAAKLLETEKRYEESAEEYRAIGKISPTDPTYVTNIGRVLELAGKPEAAVAEYRAMHERDPKNPQFHGMLAQGLAKVGQHEQAIKEYEAIASASPDATWVYNRIGDVYSGLKRWVEAQAAYLKAADRPTSSAEAYTKLEALFEAQQ
jgi:tetratricopeptide (TPR) repeat protein